MNTLKTLEKHENFFDIMENEARETKSTKRTNYDEDQFDEARLNQAEYESKNVISEYTAYNEIIGIVNINTDKYLKILTVDSREFKLKRDVKAIMNDNDCISGLTGRNSKEGPLTIIPVHNIISIKLCG